MQFGLLLIIIKAIHIINFFEAGVDLRPKKVTLASRKSPSQRVANRRYGAAKMSPHGTLATPLKTSLIISLYIGPAPKTSLHHWFLRRDNRTQFIQLQNN